MTFSWRPGRYLTQSGRVLGWLCVRAAAQAAAVVLVSRLLGAHGYGQFVSVVAVASLLAPLAGLGLAGAVLRDGARAPESHAALFRDALRVWRWSTLASAATAIALAYLLLPAGLPWLVTPAVIAIEVASISLTELVARAAQAQQRLGAFGAISAGLPLTRLAAVAAYSQLAEPTLSSWLWTYAAASAAYSLAIGLVFRPSTATRSRSELQTLSGLPFSATAIAARVQAEFNKPILARNDFALAGSLSAAQRTLDVVTLPLMALQEALWPRLYAKLDPSRDLRVMGGFLLVLAALAGTVLTAAGPILPWILGPGFDAATTALTLLAWLPTAQAGRSLMNFQVIRRERTAYLVWAAAAGTAASVMFVATFVPKKGIAGAAEAAYLTEAVMIAVLLFGCRPNRIARA
jgi:O-antigen/teichoic acid export membrane protein